MKNVRVGLLIQDAIVGRVRLQLIIVSLFAFHYN